MVSVKNFFRVTRNNEPTRVPNFFPKAVYDKTIKITKSDPIYYSVALPSVTDIKNLPDTIDDDNYAEFDPAAYNDRPKLKQSILEEIDFLKTLNLVVERNDKYYISSGADILYNLDDGIFANVGATLTNDRMKNFIGLMMTYVLPGRYWNAVKGIEVADPARAISLEAERLGIESALILMKNAFPNA